MLKLVVCNDADMRIKTLILALVFVFVVFAACSRPVQYVRTAEHVIPPMGLWDGPLHEGIKKWQETAEDCSGLHTSDCQCWESDASDCEGQEICHWCGSSVLSP